MVRGTRAGSFAPPIMKRSYFLLLLLLSACGGSGDPAATTDHTADPGEVNVYSHRHYDSDKQLFARFTELTGIKVNLLSAGDDDLLSRIEAEGANTPGDVLITADAGRLGLAKQRGLFQNVRSEVLEANIPPFRRDPDGAWFGFSARARVFAYNKNKVKPADLATYDAITASAFKGRVLARTSEHVYNQSLVASMIAHHGREAALAWCKGVVRNFAREPKGSDTDQLLAVGEGIGDVAIVNSYYVGKLMNSDDPAKQKAREVIAVAFPDANGHGTHFNVSGGGVIAHARNRENAIKLLEFLSSDEAQRVFAEGNMEFPVRAGVPVAATLQAFGPCTPDTLDLSNLSRFNAEAVKVMGEAGWR
jgi:iron(III) transport system substrate-binding protein